MNSDNSKPTEIVLIFNHRRFSDHHQPYCNVFHGVAVLVKRRGQNDRPANVSRNAAMCQQKATKTLLVCKREVPNCAACFVGQS